MRTSAAEVSIQALSPETTLAVSSANAAVAARTTIPAAAKPRHHGLEPDKTPLVFIVPPGRNRRATQVPWIGAEKPGGLRDRSPHLCLVTGRRLPFEHPCGAPSQPADAGGCRGVGGR